MPRPTFAPDSDAEDGSRRSLVLAGGGMRVAYQAGVVTALEEAGLRFHHIDGTSGGTINLAMLMTGESPAEMCDRWRALDPKDFVRPLSPRDYLRFRWPAMGGNRTIADRVFPNLGIDIEAVRAATGLTGTFNLCNFATKTAEVFEHSEMDLDLLVAAISMPVLMPAVRHCGVAYTDAMWIRDSNVPEAVRRGSDEIWLVWCIGNTTRYANGLFRQYVHMIEVAASGALFGDLASIRREYPTRPLRLHVIKPAHPIPLDPDYFLGRIDAATLIDLGYKDACDYLERMTAEGVEWGPAATGMTEPASGAAARVVLAGSFTAGEHEGALRLHLGLQSHACGDRDGGTVAVAVSGDVTVPGLGAHLLVRHGSFAATSCTGGADAPVLRAVFRASGRTYRLDGRLERRPAHGTGLAVTVSDESDGFDRMVGTGFLPFGAGTLLQLVRTLHSTNARSLRERWRLDAELARVLLHPVAAEKTIP